MTRFFANANYDFIGVRRYAYGVTAAIILPGLLFLMIKGLNYSIEFTGGTLVQIQTTKPLEVATLRSDLTAKASTAPRSRISGARTNSWSALVWLSREPTPTTRRLPRRW